MINNTLFTNNYYKTNHYEKTYRKNKEKGSTPDNDEANEKTVAETITLPDGRVYLKITKTTNGIPKVTLKKIADSNPVKLD